MSRNWIRGSVSDTSCLLTVEDLQAVSTARVEEFYSSVKALLLVRSFTLPTELKDRLKQCPGSELCPLLEDALNSGVVDAGWTEEYFSAANDISERMCGYPKACLGQWRKLREAAPPTIVLALRDSNSAKKNIVDKEQTGSKSIFRFLLLPREIRENIYRLLFLRGDIYIRDWSFGSQPSGLFRRTEYEIYDSKEKRPRRTTYTVRVLFDNRRLEFGLMLANSRIHREIAKILYGENTFKFLGTAESALAFFHDRASKLMTLHKVSMRFSTRPYLPFKGCHNSTCRLPLAPCTFIHAWRRIFNLFVHTSTGLVDFELLLDEHFWHESSWTQGAETVFNTFHLCEPPYYIRSENEGDRNFLQHVARLGGVNFRLTIAGSRHNVEKERFRRDLEELIHKQTFTRPYLAEDQVPKCTCRKRLLKECCIWDCEGKMRRGPPVRIGVF